MPHAGSSDATLYERARRYLACLPGAVSGAGGHQATWRAAIVLVRGFSLSESAAFHLLATDFNPRCDPPWSQKELIHKVQSAAQKASVSAGYLLGGSR